MNNRFKILILVLVAYIVSRYVSKLEQTPATRKARIAPTVPVAPTQFGAGGSGTDGSDTTGGGGGGGTNTPDPVAVDVYPFTFTITNNDISAPQYLD
jgi:hypothetical protein